MTLKEVEVSMIKRISYIGIILLGVYLIINLASKTNNLWQKQSELTRAQKELEFLAKENKDLKVQLEYSQTPQFLERAAREKLGLVLPGEKQVIVEEGLLKATDSGKPQNQNRFSNWGEWLKLFF